MGCGGSKLGSEGEVVPVRLRPLLRRRIEEIRRHRNVGALKGSTLSKKELLEDAAEDDENSASRDHSLHEEENVASSLKEPLIQEAANSKVAECEKITKEPIDEERSKKTKKKEEEVEDEEVDDEEEGEDNVDEERCICPGSPSFRVYYIDSQADNKDDAKNDGMDTKSPSEESIELVNSSEGSVTKIQKKGKNGRGFRRVMHKGGQVKNLLNVKSCCNSHHNNSHLVSPKAAAA